MASFLVNHCQREQFKDEPKATWNIVFKIIEGFNTHHKKYSPKNFSNSKGDVTKNNSKNLEIPKEHLHPIFNSSSETNPSIINEILQRPIANNLNFAPTIKEVKFALKKMKNNKAPGISGITMNMLKNLPEESYTILTSFIQQFWDDNNCNFDQWHKSKLALLYKGKGNHHDPNNWREICLKKIWAKVLSTIIAKRLLSDFKKINPKVNQFGHIALCSALMLR